MTTNAMVTAKSTGLAKTGGAVKQFASRLERARQSRNEKVARADAEFVDAVGRAYEAVKHEGIRDEDNVDFGPDTPPIAVDAAG
jgi:hypothetical protein